MVKMLGAMTTEEAKELYCQRIKERIAEWNRVHEYGNTGCFTHDGDELNAIRYLIQTYKKMLKKVCGGQDLPDEYRIRTPRKMDGGYMAPKSKFRAMGYAGA